MDDKYADYLYHYTTIEKLALILKNRTIRLNPLDKMDDLQEQKTADIKNLGKYTFVSSWTDDVRENIPMWNMYTNLNSGVRIGLKRNPFVWHLTKSEDLSEFLISIPRNERVLYKTFVDLAEMIRQGVYAIQGNTGDILRQVEYTDDIKKLEPVMLEETASVDFGKLGKVKNTHWSFQREWRYLMQFVRYPYGKGNDAHQKAFFDVINGSGDLPFEYYDLDIAQEAFSKMLITPSPRMTQGNRILLDTLVEKYNPTAYIKESELLGLI